MSGAGESLLEREIFAQPTMLDRFCQLDGPRVIDLGARLGAHRPAGVLIAARGSSDHAAAYAKYLFGARLGVPVALAAPSLITLYERALALDRWIAIGISQSGASPDVIRVIEEARSQGCVTLAITDRLDSPLAAAAEHVVGLGLGGERAVAATASFTTSLLALAHLASGWRGEEDPELAQAAVLAERALTLAGDARKLAEHLAPHPACAIVGRGFGYPVALEWALKLKELAGVFAEPFSAADYRHGPIALAQTGAPVFAIELRGPAAPDVRRLAEDLRERGARIVRISSDSDADLCLPKALEWLAPIPAAIAGQLLAFWLARARGRDPDHPVGLRKVTKTL
ncbi:MAG TPA: SIS domain-containing protein [Myxococcota bacterium]|nr:SIS domain-containing protein [Myxococcota bacterium]